MQTKWVIDYYQIVYIFIMQMNLMIYFNVSVISNTYMLTADQNFDIFKYSESGNILNHIYIDS